MAVNVGSVWRPKPNRSKTHAPIEVIQVIGDDYVEIRTLPAQGKRVLGNRVVKTKSLLASYEPMSLTEMVQSQVSIPEEMNGGEIGKVAVEIIQHICRLEEKVDQLIEDLS